MANRQTLAVPGYTRPGTYVGQAFNPRVVNTGDFPRIVSFVGQGVPYVIADNLEVVRGFITREQLVFTNIAPYTATLRNSSNNQKIPSGSDATKMVKIYNQNGVEVDSKMWLFFESAPGSEMFNKVEIFRAAFNPADTYYIDYQTTNPNVLDTLPVSGIQSITRIGDRRFEDRYDVGTDFLMVTSLGDVTPSSSNSGSSITGITKGVGSAGTSTGQYTKILVTSAPVDEDDYVYISGVVGMTQINGLVGKVSHREATFIVVDIDSTIFSSWVSGGTIKLSFIPSVASYYTGSSKSYTFEVLSVASSTRPQLGSFSRTLGSGTGSLTLDSTHSNFTGESNRTYVFKVVSNTSVSSVTTVIFSYEINNTNGGTVFSSTSNVAVTSSKLTDVELVDGIVVDVSSIANFVVDNEYSISTTDQASVDAIQMTWYTDSYPSNSGVLNLYSNRLITGIMIESGLSLDFGPSLAEFVTGDTFTLDVSNGDELGNGEISWSDSLARIETQTLSSTELYYDALGYVTGTARSYYLTLADIPVEIESVKQGATTISDDYYQLIEGTPYLRVVISSGSDFDQTLNTQIEYRYSVRPSLGQTYYATVKYDRPNSMYNTPMVFYGYADALAQIGYPSSENHLAVMLDYAFNVVGNQIVAVVQVKSANYSANYTLSDFQTGLTAAYGKKDLTDICVLGRGDMLSGIVQDSQRANDPLYGGLRLYWVGFPKNTSISSLRDSALNTLQVPATSYAHGTFIAVANRFVKRTVTLESGSSVQLNLDGSFFAAMLACINTGFADPNTVLYNQSVAGIDDADTFTDTEISLLGQASLTYALKSSLTGAVTITDAVTTDNSASDYHEINVMVVKQLVTKRVISAANQALIGYVARDIEDGINHVRSVIKNVLVTLISEGIISEFVDASGRPRSLVSADIDVWRSETDYTRYNFTYFFNGRYGIKRLTGLYSVDENIFATSV